MSSDYHQLKDLLEGLLIKQPIILSHAVDDDDKRYGLSGFRLVGLAHHQGQVCVRSGNKVRGFNYTPCEIKPGQDKSNELLITIPANNVRAQCDWLLNTGSVICLDGREDMDHAKTVNKFTFHHLQLLILMER